MSNDPDNFKRSVIEALVKRAANRCSNPDCGDITSGPASNESRSVTVGEAAHIYGAKAGAARHKANMSPAERSAITNAIWLCRNCHKIVDADPTEFPADLLFEWRIAHENSIGDQLGKTADRLRRKIVYGQLEGFDNTTYLARQMVIDKPDAWEFRLTAELLRSIIDPLLSRWRALERGYYTRPIKRIPKKQAILWFNDRITEIGNLVPALAGIINDEFAKAWGAPGVSGSPIAILRVSVTLVSVTLH